MRVHPTVTASTMITQFDGRHKVRCHTVVVENTLEKGEGFGVELGRAIPESDLRQFGVEVRGTRLSENHRKVGSFVGGSTKVGQPAIDWEMSC
jgi:hypothetical protein